MTAKPWAPPDPPSPAERTRLPESVPPKWVCATARKVSYVKPRVPWVPMYNHPAAVICPNMVSPASEPSERRLVGPSRDDHGRRDQHTRRVAMRRNDRDRFPGLDDESLVVTQTLEGLDDPLERFRAAGSPTPAAVHDQRRRVLGDFRVEIVEQAAQRSLLLPAAAAAFRAHAESHGRSPPRDYRATARPCSSRARRWELARAEAR